MASPPESRSEFEIAIVCALAREYNSISRIVDQFWDKQYGRATGDSNTYATGRMGDFNIVLVLLSGMGKSSAAGAAANLRTSYPELKLVLLTGICGGVPSPGNNEELHLGDVVIGKTVVQYDLGRIYPDGFQMKDTLEDSLGRLSKNIRNFVELFKTDFAREQLEERAASHLEELQARTAGKRRNAVYRYPGADSDILFKADYRHKHRIFSQRLCDECSGDSGGVCEDSRKSTCQDLGCDEKELVHRDRITEKKDLEAEGRPKEAQAPYVFVGRFGSGNTVLKSGEERDKMAKRHGIMAFQMEGAGVWDEIPCIIVKGVCDYADSHKNKLWQDFAAATAACVAKALVERYPQTDKLPNVFSNNHRVDDATERASSGIGSVHYGNVSGGNVLTGIHSRGGTQNFTFGSPG